MQSISLDYTSTSVNANSCEHASIDVERRVEIESQLQRRLVENESQLQREKQGGMGGFRIVAIIKGAREFATPKSI